MEHVFCITLMLQAYYKPTRYKLHLNIRNIKRPKEQIVNNETEQQRHNEYRLKDGEVPHTLLTLLRFADRKLSQRKRTSGVFHIQVRRVDLSKKIKNSLNIKKPDDGWPLVNVIVFKQ